MHTLIVFSHLRWGFVYQRPQHLLSRLARDYRVVFIEEPVHSAGQARFERVSPCPNVEVLVPHTPVDAPGFHDDQCPVLQPLLVDFLRERGIEDYLVWFYTPMALPLITPLRPLAVVYDCMDELSAFRNAPGQLRQREAALLKVAQLVLTGGPALYENKRHLHDNVHCLPSSVDAAHFDLSSRGASDPHASQATELQGDLPTPRLGYYGVIDERLDLALVAACAAARPDWQFVMVGPVVKIDPDALPTLPNIRWLGMQAYDTLPHLMAGWDVCLMPFALNESTRFISPTKTLEYMAGGKPIVSTPVHDVVGLYGEVVTIAHGEAEFIAACAAALAEDGPARDDRLRAAAKVLRDSSWDKAASGVSTWLEHAVRSRSAASTGHVPANATLVAPALARASDATSVLRARQRPSGALPTVRQPSAGTT